MEDSDIDYEYLDMMVYNFNYAIDNNKEKVYLGYSEDTDGKKDYWCQRKDWSVTIDILIDEAIKLEEYEYCNDLKNIKKRL